ncbi:MAG: YjgP/YjgQ family permease [Candidatus Omnitrophota bacterium]|jgi:lipopolysaccharide export system permease protein|nr:MAG: YjgP/YjgQ family permease [Candidatus Omnitrophota bacterium]
MRILDRYILKSVVGIFIGCTLTFLFLYVVVDIFSHLDDFLKMKVGLSVLIKYYLSFLPIIFVQVTPISCLLSTLYTFSKLNTSNELIAMRSAGMSIFQITKTVVLFGAIISMLVFWVNDKFVPNASATTEAIKEDMEKSNPKKSTETKQEDITNLSMYGLRNRLFFIKRFSVATNTMFGITILEQDQKQNIVKKIVASKGVYENGLWKFFQCITYNFDQNGQIKDEPVYFDQEIMAIAETPKDFLSQRQRTDLMTIAQIDDYIWRLSKSGAENVINNLKVELFQRFASPFTSLVIIILGIPFSFVIRRRAAGISSLGLSIMMGFLYYGMNAVSIALGKKGVLPPLTAATLSHIIALSIGLYLISKIP